MKLQVKLLVIAAAVLAIMLTLYYNSATFRYSSSEPKNRKRLADDRRDRKERKVNTPRKRRPSPEEVQTNEQLLKSFEGFFTSKNYMEI
ncbi:MAG: hypothetical protein EB127_18045, partial [Alphaproteobacteria bacterium]|nr:hypothetical protein [Alphaproteobacteria bacterium]